MNYENALWIFIMIITILGVFCLAELFAYMLNWK